MAWKGPDKAYRDKLVEEITTKDPDADLDLVEKILRANPYPDPWRTEQTLLRTSLRLNQKYSIKEMAALVLQIIEASKTGKISEELFFRILDGTAHHLDGIQALIEASKEEEEVTVTAEAHPWAQLLVRRNGGDDNDNDDDEKQTDSSPPTDLDVSLLVQTEKEEEEIIASDSGSDSELQNDTGERFL